MIDQEIKSRVNAYRGNPEALQQQYSVSKELIDLLALQKIKQEMDAGSRQMQLMMAQQGKKPPIKQQLEQEVVGRTKQEMQQQLAGTMQQEATEKQKALQQAVQSQEQGVAGLPADNMMPTKAMAAGGILDFSDEPAPDYEEGMASGGIVAFGKGGNVWDTKKTPYDEIIVQEARRRGIDPVVLKRLIGSESSFNPRAVSPRGEKYGIGIAQIADVHNMSKEDRLNPSKAIPAAAELFAQYLKRADGDYERALQMYKGASSEGGKQRMAGPIRRILEGVASVAIPSAYAGDKNAPAKQETSSTIGRFFSDLPFMPQEYSEESKQKLEAIQKERADLGKKLYDLRGPLGLYQQTPQQQAETEKIKARMDQLDKQIMSAKFPAISGDNTLTTKKQEREKQVQAASVPPAPVEPPSRPYPDASPSTADGKFKPYPDQLIPREVDPTANQPSPTPQAELAATVQANNPPAPPAAPPAAAAPAQDGLAALLPPEYRKLAKQQATVLGDKLGVDPEEMARQRGIEYYQQVGVPTEQAAAEKAKRLAGLEALDAERVKYDRENEITEALVNARGSTWQGGLGSFGRNAIETRRRNTALQRQFMEESNKAKDELANIGLGVKSGVYGAKTGARKEYEDQQGKALTEAGLGIGRAMSAETQRAVNEATLRSNEMIRDVQIEANKITGLNNQISHLENSKAQVLRATLTPLITAKAKMQENYNTLSGGKLTPQQLADIKALEKEIELQNSKISDYFERRILSLGGGNSGDLNQFKIEKISK